MAAVEEILDIYLYTIESCKCIYSLIEDGDRLPMLTIC